ncbi:MAG: hypothetical protein ACM3O8_13870 [Methylococcaceae bacterium]|nr:hypothetical protein [Prolixibacteraceae bacterium]
MFERKQKRYDRILTGWLLGTIVPLIIFLVIYGIKFREYEFLVYLKNLLHMRVFFKILSLCVFPNLAFFFLFYKSKYDMAARGVIMATFMYAFLVLIARMI